MSDNVARFTSVAESVPGPGSDDRFLNRELSWLQFNWRVIDEARNENHPLLERLRFLSISSINLNEFFMVRVAGLKGQVSASVDTPSAEGKTPAQQLAATTAEASRLMAAQQACWRQLSAALRDAGIAIVAADELDATERAWLETWFLDRIFPALTPFAVDSTHPFPFIPNSGVCLALDLRRESDDRHLQGLVPLPSKIDRFVRLPGDAIRYIAME